MKLALTSVLFASLATGLLHAGEMVTKQEVATSSPFDQGTREFQLLVGGTGSFFTAGTEVDPDFSTIDACVRIGWMLNTPDRGGWLRGNAEFLLEAYGAGVVEGPGNAIAGAVLLLRYNFVQPKARLVPYLQLDGGGAWNDGYKEKVQELFGQALEFHLGASAGFRWFVQERAAITFEGRYRHISNNDMADRNLGVNSLGGFIGFSWFF